MKIEYYVEFGEKEIMQVGRLRSIEKFKGKRERENFIFNTFIYFKPVKRFENRSGVSEFRSFNNSTSKDIFGSVGGDLFETLQ